MSVAELKEKIIAKVTETSDEGVLKDYWIAISRKDESDTEFTPEELQQFDEIDQEVERGEYYTHEEFMSMMQDRLTRYGNEKKD